MRKILLAMTILGTLAVLSEGRVDLTATKADAIAAREVDAPLAPNGDGHMITMAPQPGASSCSFNVTDVSPGMYFECGGPR